MSTDIIPALRSYLLPLVAPADVATRVPDPYVAPMVQVRRVGGNALPPVRDRPRLDVWCWHDTDQESMALALTVRAAVWALSGTTLLGGVVCYAVEEFLGPRLADDPIRGTAGGGRRTWATYQLTVRDDTIIQPAPTAFS